MSLSGGRSGVLDLLSVVSPRDRAAQAAGDCHEPDLVPGVDLRGDRSLGL